MKYGKTKYIPIFIRITPIPYPRVSCSESANVIIESDMIIGVIVVPILVIGVIVGKKLKRATPVIIEKTIEKTVEAEKKYEDKYDEKLSIYLVEQILKKLEEMHSLKILSKTKYSKIKETQEFVRENIGKNFK